VGWFLGAQGGAIVESEHRDLNGLGGGLWCFPLFVLLYFLFAMRSLWRPVGSWVVGAHKISFVGRSRGRALITEIWDMKTVSDWSVVRTSRKCFGHCGCQVTLRPVSQWDWRRGGQENSVWRADAERSLVSFTKARWIDRMHMIADCLTKKRGRIGPLLRLLETGKFSVTEEAVTLDARLEDRRRVGYNKR